MSRRGRYLDNAMAESFFHTMKTEMFHHKKYKTMTSVKKIYCRLSTFIIIKDYIHFLGICRLKSLLRKQPKCPLLGCKITSAPKFPQSTALSTKDSHARI
jgi:transposase InsO family protein